MRPSGVRRLLGLVALLLLLPHPGSTPSAQVVNALEGGSVQLKPEFGAGKVKWFVWNKGSSSRVAEVEPPGAPRYYGACEGRCELDTTSGALTLRGLKLDDADRYTAEVDILDPLKYTYFDLRVYPRLRRPSLNCFEADGEITIRCIHTPEPPTFLWVSSRLGPLTGADPDYRLGDGNKTLKIQREKAPLLGSLQCVVKNPVTENRTAVASQCLIEGSAEEVTALEGGSVQLTPKFGPGEVQSFVWKRGEDKVVEVDFPGAPQYYGDYEGRCELDTTSGALTLRGLKLNDTDNYTAAVLIGGFYTYTHFHLRVFHWLTPPKGDVEMKKEEKEKTVRGRLGVVVTVIVVVGLVVFAVFKWCIVARAERRRKQQARGETRGEREREKRRKENKEQSGGGNNKQEERREEKGKEKKVEKEKKIEDL